MQRQKTIAKWLAVILLLSVAVASYIALNSILNKKPFDNIAGADSDNDNKIEEQQPTVQTPIYSALPRKGEQIANTYIQHIGGEDDDVLLDTIYANNKRYIIFSTASTQHDVTGSGIYIATLYDGSLQSVCKIAQRDEEYVSCAIMSSGILVITKAQYTILRLFNLSLSTIAINPISNYKQIVTYTHANTLYAIAYDGQMLHQIEIAQSLEIKESTFVFEMAGADILEVLAYGEKTLIFANGLHGAKMLIFDKTNGFSLKNEMVNCLLKQVLPLYTIGNQFVYTLSTIGDKATICCFSMDLQLENQAVCDNAKCSVLLPYESGVALLTNNSTYTFCPHLDLLSQMQFNTTFDEEVSSFEYVRGTQNLFIAKTPNAVYLYTLDDKNINAVFSFNSCKQNIIVERQQTKVADNTYSYCIIFSAHSQNSFAYMNFGKNDVFVVAI